MSLFRCSFSYRIVGVLWVQLACPIQKIVSHQVSWSSDSCGLFTLLVMFWGLGVGVVLCIYQPGPIYLLVSRSPHFDRLWPSVMVSICCKKFLWRWVIVPWRPAWFTWNPVWKTSHPTNQRSTTVETKQKEMKRKNSLVSIVRTVFTVRFSWMFSAWLTVYVRGVSY